MAGKRDPNLDHEAQVWIEAILGEKFPAGTYEDALKDGIILCKYGIETSNNKKAQFKN